MRWAGAGKTFVLEGPPGTGKSQTITNLIAHCLAEGKKVLFVAEKQAALDVVQRRLSGIGLGVFTLDLHARRQTTNAVRDQIREAIEFESQRDPGYASVRAQYRNVVERLSSYPERLHESGPVGMSLWDANELLLENLTFGGGEVVGVRLPRPLVMGEFPLEDLYEIAHELDVALHALGVEPAASPWRLAGPAADGRDVDRHAVSQAMRALDAAEPEIVDRALRVLVDAAESRGHRDALVTWLDALAAGIGRVPHEAYALVSMQWRNQCSQLLQQIDQLRSTYAVRMQGFTPEVLGLDLDTLHARSQAADKKFFGKKKARQAVIADLSSVRVQPDAGLPDPKSLTSVLSGLLEVRQAAAELARQITALPGLGDAAVFNPFRDPDVDGLRHQIHGWEASAAYARALDSEAMRDAATRVAHTHRSGSGTARTVFQARDALLAALGSTKGDVAAWKAGVSWEVARVRSQPRWQADANAGFVGLSRWVRVRTVLQQVADLGMDDLVRRVLEGTVRGGEVEPSVRLAAAREMQAERLDTTNLATFDPVHHEGTVDRFVEIGSEVRKRLRRELPAMITAKRRTDRQWQRELQLVRQQVARRRGGMTIRQLLERHGSVVADIMPCFMMSPASVARFLPAGSIQFDVVVFDEASQIRVPEAIGAMSRGKAVVVVGDSQQMPPSSMFTSSGSSDDDELTDDEQPVPVDMDSILTEAVEANFHRLMLSWHYRSRHESLIAFSNQQYYEGRLASFPTPPDDDAAPAVELRRVDGQWEGGKTAARVNRVEAAAVVDEIVRLLEEDSDRSIGVVTFNMQQRDLILDLLEELAESDSRVSAALSRESEPLFVKNLENVQGDERDIVLFTLAFSKDANGRVPLNWGPLSRPGGEKRLNVAITRAKAKVTMFSSFNPWELDLSTSRSVGLAHLKDYLLMARDGAEATFSKRSDLPARHTEEVARRLAEAGLEVRTGVGLSDFTVDLAVRTRAEAPWMAVLLDGPSWAKRASVGDRDGLPRAVLTEQMGWPAVERVWLPHWLRDPDEVVKGLVAKAWSLADDGAVSQLPVQVPVASSASAAEAATKVIDLHPDRRGTRRAASTDGLGPARRPWGLRRPETAERVVPVAGSADDQSGTPVAEPAASDAGPATQRIARMETRSKALEDYVEYVGSVLPVGEAPTKELIEGLRRIVEVEGPILGGRLQSVYVKASGRTRLTKQVTAELSRAISAAVRRGILVADNPLDQVGVKLRTYRLPDQPQVRLRRLGARELTDVPPGELAALMSGVARQRGWDDPREVMKGVLSLLGLQRLRRPTEEHLMPIYTYARGS